MVDDLDVEVESEKPNEIGESENAEPEIKSDIILCKLSNSEVCQNIDMKLSNLDPGQLVE